IDALPGVALSTAEDEEASASLPAATESLGAGASGNFDLVVESGWGALELLATKVGESTTARGVSTGGAVQQKITSADSTKIHLSSRRPGGGFLVHSNHCPLYCTKGQVSLAYWSQFSMVLFRGRVLERWYRPIRDSLAIRRKDLLQSGPRSRSHYFGGKWLLRNHRRNAHASRNVARSHLDSSSLKAPFVLGKPRWRGCSPNASMRAAFTIVKIILFWLISMPAFPEPLSARNCIS